MADLTSIALGINAAADLKTTETIAAATAWDAASPVGLLLGTKDSVLLTADRKVRMDATVAEAITAGKLRGFVLWTFESAVTGVYTAP